MQAVSNSSYPTPVIAGPQFAGLSPTRASLPTFGNAEAPDNNDTISAETPQKKGLIATLTEFVQQIGTLMEFVQQNGVVQGTRKFVGVMTDVLAWSQAFEGAKPDSTYAERLQSLFYLAFAEFCEGFQSSHQDLKPAGKKIAHTLYANILRTYPKLIVAKPESLPIDVVAKTIQSASHGDLETELKNIQVKYSGQEELSLDDLKKEVDEALSR